MPASPGEKCDGKWKGCKVEAGAAQRWNDLSRDWWRKLNRVAKLRADRAIRRLGSEKKGGLLVYEWELQGRGVWHLHVVLGMETAIERAWAFEYVRALRELGPRYGFGWVDAKPLRSPQPAANGVSGYLSKYLAKRRPDGTLEVTETVRSAGRTLINYVSRNLTARSGCTMRALRNARIVWAWREGHFDSHRLDEWDYIVAGVSAGSAARPCTRAVTAAARASAGGRRAGRCRHGPEERATVPSCALRGTGRRSLRLSKARAK